MMSVWLSIAPESPRRRESPQSPSLRLRIQPRWTRPLRYRVHRGWILGPRFGLWRLSPLLFGDIGVRSGLRKLRPHLHRFYRLRAPLPHPAHDPLTRCALSFRSLYLHYRSAFTHYSLIMRSQAIGSCLHYHSSTIAFWFLSSWTAVRIICS